jgi:hypothetical protein
MHSENEKTLFLYFCHFSNGYTDELSHQDADPSFINILAEARSSAAFVNVSRGTTPG